MVEMYIISIISVQLLYQFVLVLLEEKRNFLSYFKVHPLNICLEHKYRKWQ